MRSWLPSIFVWSRQAMVDAVTMLPFVAATVALILLRRFDPYNALSNDLLNYSRLYDDSFWLSPLDFVRQYRFEPGFTGLMKLFSFVGLSFTAFHIAIQLFFYWTYYRFLRAVMPFSRLYTVISFFSSIWLPTFAIIANQAMRQTLAMGVLFAALAYLLRLTREGRMGRPWASAAFLCLLAGGVLFHYSVAIIAVLMLGALFVPFRWVLGAWTVALALYATNYPGVLGLLETYLYPVFRDNSTVSAGAETYILGFKPLFLLMSIVPLAALAWARVWRMQPSRPLTTLFALYFGVNAFCLLLSYLPYHDRLFHYTWALIPAIALGTLSETVIHVRARRRALA